MTSHGTIGRVVAVRRYPVKSLSGETLGEVRLDGRGLVGDRLWSVRDPDGKLGSGKSNRRFRRMDGLLALVAEYDGDVPVVTFPDGRRLGPGPDLDEALSWHVGRPVSLGREGEVSHFDDGPVHLVTTSSVQAVSAEHGADVDPRRFRANLLVDNGLEDGFAEDGWLDRRLVVGEALLEVVQPMPRCVMVDMAQVGVDAEGRLLQTLTTHRDGAFGVLLRVARPGLVRVGDDVALQ
ncbi:MAG TPA: MOSC domain-containing protein [Marmoricola sp.]|nr:MOSC domain-containing protein [Marmoricola sp.]